MSNTDTIWIKQQINSHEALNEQLAKAEALAFVILQTNLSECPEVTLNYYLQELHNLIETSRTNNEIILAELMQKNHSHFGDQDLSADYQAA